MGITGNLKTMELAELLQWLSQGQKTGTLVIVNQEIAKQVYFQHGKIISSASSDPREFLGHFLVSLGHIDEEQLADAIARQESEKKMLGSLLVEMDAISAEHLDRALRRKAEETIYSLFEWEQGDFRFLDDQLPPYEMVPISLDVTGLILEAMRRLDELSRIRLVVPSRDAVPVVVRADELLASPELTDGQKRVLGAINDDRTVEELAMETHAGEFYVSEVLYHAAQRKHIKVVRARIQTVIQNVVTEVPGPPPVEAPPAPAPSAPAELSASALVERGDRHLEGQRLSEAIRHYRAAAALEPENKGVLAKAKDVETRIRSQLEEAGIVGSAVPHLNVGLDELTHLAVSPKAGFILSRVDGRYTLESILKISPMAPLEAMMVFKELVDAGHVTLT